jgi:nucleoside-diphosphate-sugar epimerase
MNVLITGGTGNLGSRLVVPLIRRGERVVVYDIQPKPHVPSAEFKQVKVVTGDLGDREAVVKVVASHQIDTIFHFGAILSASAEENPYPAWRVNMDGTMNVLDAARLANTRKVIFTSTVATYGEGISRLDDETPQWPQSLYGVAKVAGERLGVYYHQRFGVDFRGLRLPPVLTARGPDGGTSAYCSAVFEHSARNGAYDFYVRPSTRAPMIYIEDAIAGLLQLHDAAEEKLSRRVYNVVGLSPTAEDLAAAVRRHLPKVKISYTPDPLRMNIVESWPHQVDDSAARRDWGWNPVADLDKITRGILDELSAEC